MNPLMFIDWRSVNSAFCGLMWLTALLLVILVASELTAGPSPAHRPTHAVAR